MSDLSLSDVSEKMREIDIAMLMTHTEGGDIAGRPMSNNRDVDYDGDSYYFTSDDTRTVADIERNPRVALTFHGNRHLLGKPGIQINVEGQAQIIRDKQAMREHWTPDLDRWFEQGVDTPGVVMVKVHANRVHYWDGMDHAEIVI